MVCFQGELVYAGFGEVANFDQLSKYNIDVNGFIVLMRLGRFYKGQVVCNCLISNLCISPTIWFEKHSVLFSI